MSETVNEEPPLMLRTIHVGILQKVFQLVKDILIDVPLSITPDAIYIGSFDKTRTGCLNITLYGSKFEHYTCNENKILLCANAKYLYTELSDITNKEILYLYINPEDNRHDGIYDRLTIEHVNEELKQRSVSKMSLINFGDEELPNMNIDYSVVFSMPTSLLYNLLRSMDSVRAESVEIQVIGKKIIFVYDSPAGPKTKEQEEKPGYLSFTKHPSEGEVVRGQFSVKTLYRYVRSTSFCPMVEVQIENDMPIALKYIIGANLGEITEYLEPL